MVQVQPGDSLSKADKSGHRKETVAAAHRRHNRETDARTGGEATVPGSSAGHVTSPMGPVMQPAPVVRTPVATAYQDNIEFKLVSAVGSIRGQTIKMTVVLTTTAANWHIWSAVKSIIDPGWK